MCNRDNAATMARTMEQKHIRNLVIISHIDHGKSTLADRFLELTETVPERERRDQVLDAMSLEREKGITIKMQPVRMHYGDTMLNLIDTPGHVDFSYEVSRGLAAVEGAVLLVDATQGVQAQTLHTLSHAKEQGLTIIPAVNKIDMAHAQPDRVTEEVNALLGDDCEVHHISAKEGTGVSGLLERLVSDIPPPAGAPEAQLRALVFDSVYDPYKGVIAYVRVRDGAIEEGDDITLLQQNERGAAKEIGFFAPHFERKESLRAGEIGYIATGIKDADAVRVGDTITHTKSARDKAVHPLPGYREPKPVVFMSIFPEESGDFDRLKQALGHLHLNDPAFTYSTEAKSALGQGFRASFLGNLHAEIILERIRREFDISIVVSRPQVEYRVRERGEERAHPVYVASDFPDHSKEARVWEQWVQLSIVVPGDYLGAVLQLLEDMEGEYGETEPLSEDRMVVEFSMPLRSLMAGNFYDTLKSATEGYASLNYDLLDWREADLVKLTVLLAGREEELLARIVPRSEAYKVGRRIVKQLKELLPREQFPVPIQAAAEGDIIARETMPAARKDVTGDLYGGDVTRKRKLLKKQRKGKKELAQQGEVRLDSDTYLELMRKAV